MDKTEAEKNEFDSIAPIRNRFLARFLEYVPPVGLGLGILLVFLDPGGLDYMLATGVGALLLALLAFQSLMGMIQPTYTKLWHRGIIKTKGADAAAVSQTIPLAEYQDFLNWIENELHRPRGHWIVGGIFAALGLLIWFDQACLFGSRSHLFGCGLPDTLTGVFGPSQPAGIWRYQLGFFLEPASGLLIGLLAWRLYVISLSIWRLSRRFDLVPQFAHPDKAGGLSPIGHLCLQNALIVIIPAIHLGLWIILAPSVPRYAGWQPLLMRYLPIPLLFAIVGFVIPLVAVHSIMVRHRDRLQKEFDELGERIYKEARQLLVDSDHIAPDELARQKSALENYDSLYQRYKDVPVWPVNVQISVRFLSAVAIPLLSLSGLRQPLVDLAKNLFDLASGS